MNTQKLVSIIIPSYNREKTILSSIDSVLSQTYNNIEVIIVDDCSRDNTETIISNHYRNDSRVIYHKLEKNSGACVARNTGVCISKGDYIGFLDSDDTFKKDKIEKQIRLLEETGADICATDYFRVLRNGQTKLIKTQSGTKENLLNELLYCNFITTGTLLGHRACFTACPFDEQLPRYQDWDLVLRLCKLYSVILLEEPTLDQFYQPMSITASTGPIKTLKALDVIYKKNEADYKNCQRAYSQIHWLMGVNSVLTRTGVRYKDLWLGVIGNQFSLKRFLLYLIARLHMFSFFTKLYNSAI